MRKIKLKGYLKGDKVYCTDKKIMDSLTNKNFGERYDNFTVLDVYESLYLTENRNMIVKENNKILNKEQVFEKIIKETKDKFMMQKYVVYKEIIEKGYIVKTGLKFGFDFRIYPKNKTIEEAHTKYVVLVWPQDKQLKTENFARSIRMALGLKTEFVLAVVDNELETIYYKINRFKF